MKITDKYFIKTNRIKNKPGEWDSLIVAIFRKEGEKEEQIGEYERNYHSVMNTFYPFKQGDKEYALYSKDYTATRVMTLPDCKDLCGEEDDDIGFCPVSYYVPCEPEHDQNASTMIKDFDNSVNKVVKHPERLGQHGFVAGCIWGDDSDWKIEYLDLTKLSEGKMERIDKFGYLEMPLNIGDNLEECICMSRFPRVYISTYDWFDLDKEVEYPLLFDTSKQEQKEANQFVMWAYQLASECGDNKFAKKIMELIREEKRTEEWILEKLKEAK